MSRGRRFFDDASTMRKISLPTSNFVPTDDTDLDADLDADCTDEGGYCFPQSLVVAGMSRGLDFFDGASTTKKFLRFNVEIP
jgi:hypothetical protein